MCQDRILYCGQLDVYEQASELLKELADLQVSDSTIQRMCVYYGDLIGDQLYDKENRKFALSSESDSCIASSVDSTEDIVYAQFDGGFIFSDADWQEVKLGRVFLKSDCQLIDNEERGNRIAKSEYAASLGHFSHFTEKYEVLIDEALSVNRKLVFITDGAVWMRNWMKDRYQGAIQILDFFHVCEHLGEFAKDVVSKVRENHQLWFNRQKESMKKGHVLKVIHRIRTLPIDAKNDQEKRRKLLKYLDDNLYRMDYGKYRDQGLMIGSGPIEAAHRTVVQKRMKLSGQRWSDNGAQTMLNLRCAYKSGRRKMLTNIIARAI